MRPLGFLPALLACAATAHAEVKIAIEHHNNDQAVAGFKFPGVPPPRRGDAAAKATLTLIEGDRDPNSGDLKKLHDGALPNSGDQPNANFFFRTETAGGRVLMDLGSVIEIR